MKAKILYLISLCETAIKIIEKIIFVKQSKQNLNMVIYQTAKKCLGKDMSKKYNSLGCMEALNAVWKKATGKEAGGGVSTYLGYIAIKDDTRFRQVGKPDLGDIIMFPSGYGGKDENGKSKHGHALIMSDNGKAMSNNSKNSLWDEHLTLKECLVKYKTFPVFYYRLIK